MRDRISGRPSPHPSQTFGYGTSWICDFGCEASDALAVAMALSQVGVGVGVTSLVCERRTRVPPCKVRRFSRTDLRTACSHSPTRALCTNRYCLVISLHLALEVRTCWLPPGLANDEDAIPPHHFTWHNTFCAAAAATRRDGYDSLSLGMLR